MSLEDDVRRFFEPGGNLSRAHPAYEPRPGQAALALEVLQTLRDGAHLVAEAGTGTGKTLAYLVPAVLLGSRVIVSTGTRNLQDQLASKDIPFLQQRCGLRFTACVLKGRDNYLCRHRFEAFRGAPTFDNREEAAAWPAVLRFAEETVTGDVAELAELPENPTFWSEVNARNATCLGARCPRFDDCHLQEVRREARRSDVVVVNHHLYLADAAIRQSNFGAVLPEAEHVVFDEAHRLEDAATSFFGRTVSSWRLRDLADDTLRELARAGMDLPSIQRACKRLGDAAAGFAAPWGTPEGRVLLPASLTAAQDDGMAGTRRAVKDLGAALLGLPEAPAVVEPLSRRCEEVLGDIDHLRSREDAGWVFWYEVRGRGAFLTATPVDVSSLLRERVFLKLKASVLCSATLAVDGRMAHVRARLGLDPPSCDAPLEIREATHSSPFDHERQGLLYLPASMPEPRDPTFASACAAQVKRLVAASRGRAFLLFTSFGNLHRVHAALEGEIPYTVLVQGDAPKGELLRRFQEDAAAVLFATSSFWEGVDVPGPALSLVVIDKLPFAVPSDPIVAARCRLIEDAGGSPFAELSLPSAVLALKQGVGRLIRSGSDRGVVALLDPRITKSRYGRSFVDNLPPFRRTRRCEDVESFFGHEEVGPA